MKYPLFFSFNVPSCLAAQTIFTTAQALKHSARSSVSTSAQQQKMTKPLGGGNCYGHLMIIHYLMIITELLLRTQNLATHHLIISHDHPGNHHQCWCWGPMHSMLNTSCHPPAKVVDGFVDTAITLSKRVFSQPLLLSLLLSADEEHSEKNPFNSWSKLQALVQKAKSPKHIEWVFCAMLLGQDWFQFSVSNYYYQYGLLGPQN